MPKLADFITELRRRRAFRVAAVYAGVAFVVFQIVDAIFEPLHIPSWGGTTIIVLLLIGFPIAIALAWAFDITDHRIVCTKGPKWHQPKELYHFVVGNKSLAIIVPVWALLREPAPADAIRSIAVLPLANFTGDAEQAYFVEGMHDAIIT